MVRVTVPSLRKEFLLQLRACLPFFTAILCGLVFLTRILLVWLTPMSTLVGFILDDGFYYFKIAANIAAGKGSTFDGIHITDGYHPLWCYLLVSVFSIVKDPYLRVRCALTLALVFGLITTWLLFKILRPRFGIVVACFAAGFYGTSWSVFCDQITGQEFALFACLLCLAIIVWDWGINQLRNNSNERLFALIAMGVISGLLTLSRLDAILFLFVGFLILWRVLKSSLLFKMIHLLVITLICDFVLLPYLAWKIPATGHISTVSGRIKVFWGQSRLPKLFGREHLTISLQEMFVADALGATQPFRDLISPILRRIGEMRSKIDLLSAYIVLLLTSIGIYCIFKTNNLNLHFLVLYGGLHYLAYGIYLLGNYQGYQTPEFLIVILLVPIGIQYLYHHLFKKRDFVPLFFVLTILLFNAIYSSKLLIHYKKVSHNIHNEMYQMALWIKKHLPENIRIGSWNAGILGYFSQRTIINLDGLVNNHHYFEYYIKTNKIQDYIKNKQIAYLADYDVKVLKNKKILNLVKRKLYWHPSKYGVCFIVEVNAD